MRGERDRQREQKVLPELREAPLGVWRVGLPSRTRAGPTMGGHRGGGGDWTKLGGRGIEEGAGGEGRSHKCGTGKTKSELGVSIGNSAFTFLLHFYFKHRKRERKQIEKKNVQEKKRKKKD